MDVALAFAALYTRRDLGILRLASLVRDEPPEDRLALAWLFALGDEEGAEVAGSQGA